MRYLGYQDALREAGIPLDKSLLFDGTVAENIGYGKRHATEDEIRRAAAIANADGFVEENGMIDEDGLVDEDGMIGGGLSETSRANMTEIRNMKTDVLSPTSADVSNKKVNPLSQQDGGCDILSSLSGFLSGKSTTSQVFNEGMNKGVNKMQGGGAETSLSSLVGMTSVMNGGKKQSSEEINVMPFYSSTSGSEYYNEMQRENRYT